MEMRCYHKILHISYKDHVTNEKVHAKIQQAIEPHKCVLVNFTVCHGDVLTIVIVRHFGLKCIRDPHMCVNGSPDM